MSTSQRHKLSRRTRGFTMIELIMVMVMIGALVALASVLIVQPFQASDAIARRAELVDTAQTTLNRVTREVRHALPNSVRTRISGNRRAIEFLLTRTGGRYRRQADSSGAGDLLDITLDADSFDVLGGLPDATEVDVGAAGINQCVTGNADCVVIYNTGDPGVDAYSHDNLATITSATDASLSFDNANGMAAFPLHSPYQRFFVLDGPVSFVCDLAAGELYRYSGYSIAAAQPIVGGDFGGGRADLLAGKIAGCSFSYTNGTGSRHGLLSINIDIADSATTEQVSLLQQAHVLNVP